MRTFKICFVKICISKSSPVTSSLTLMFSNCPQRLSFRPLLLRLLAFFAARAYLAPYTVQYSVSRSSCICVCLSICIFLCICVFILFLTVLMWINIYLLIFGCAFVFCVLVFLRSFGGYVFGFPATFFLTTPIWEGAILNIWHFLPSTNITME